MKTQLVKIASRIVPNKIVEFAYKQLTSPQVHKLRPYELEIIDKAEKKSKNFKGFSIQTYRWGKGNKSILLVHGWEGQAGNFGNIIDRLLQEGYTVYAFDGPSHGFSSKGKTSLFEFVDLVGELITEYGVKELISHSFGGVATTFALSMNPTLKIDKYLLLTTPDKFSERIDDVAKKVGITENVKLKLIDRLAKETGKDHTV